MSVSKGRSWSRWRVAVRVAMGLGALAGIGVLLLPLWLPWVLAPALRSVGIEVGAYERRGYGRFALRDVRFSNADVVFAADRIETLQPVYWIARPLGLSGVPRAGFGDEPPGRMPIEVQGWRLELPLSGPPSAAPVLRSLTQLLDAARAVMDWVSLFRPGVELRNGEIQYAGEVLAVHRAVGGVDRIVCELLSRRFDQPVTFEFGWVSDKREGTRFAFEAGTELMNVPLSNRTLLAQAPVQAGWDLAGDGSWGENRWSYEGVVGPENWWPASLELEAMDWRVSLAPWGSPGYPEVNGGVRMSWAQEELEFAVELRAEPAGEGTPTAQAVDRPPFSFPPLAVDVAGTVTFSRAVLSRLTVRSPGLVVDLDRSIEVDLGTRTLAEPTSMNFSLRLDELSCLDSLWADLASKLPEDVARTPVHGAISGTIQAGPNPDGWPVAELSVSSDGFGWSMWEADALVLEGELEWPRLRWSEFQVRLGDGSRMTAKGEAQVTGRRPGAFTVQAELTPDLVRPFLPGDVEFGRIALELEAEGELTSARLQSSGMIEITELALPRVKPLEPVRIEWEPSPTVTGEGERPEHRWKLGLQAEDSTIQVAGALRLALDDGWIEVPLSSLRWQPGTAPEEPPLPEVRLAVPVTLTLHAERGAGGDRASGWTLNLPEVVVRAETDSTEARPSDATDGLPLCVGSLDIDWPRRGALDLRLEGWSVRWLRDWLEVPETDESIAPLLWDAELDRLRFMAKWDEGPLVYAIEAAAHAPHPLRLMSNTTGDRLEASARLTGDGSGVKLDTVRIADRGGIWLEGHGSLGLAVVPGDAGRPIHWDPGAAVEFAWATKEREPISVTVDGLGRIDFEGLTARVEVGGSILEPEGTVHVGLDRLLLTRDGVTEPGEIPEITGLELALRWGPTAVELESLEMTVAGQPIELAMALPLADGFWEGFPGTLSPVDLVSSHGRLKIGPIRIETLGPLLPGLIRAQGELTAEAQWEPGRKMSGLIVFSGLATHPLPTSGAVQELHGQIELDGSEVRIRELSASLGGRRLALGGWLNLDPTIRALIQQRPRSREAILALPFPFWDLAIMGERLPVVRRPGMVIRTGLDIRTTYDGESAPLISGVVTPGESVFITDIRTMLPRGPATPMPRPPFVRVEHPRLADWRLDIRVEGDEFLRVRSPVFRGLVSVGMNVGGRLGEPVLIGDVMVAKGRLQFPFGSLEVTQGLVSLSEANPAAPSVLVNASSRVYGYQVTMSISGTAESPVVVFSSIPPLPSEAILLMLTAGQLPRDELTFSAQQRATALASYLGKTLIDSWALEDPGEERLIIRSGESISVEGRVTYYVEYLLFGRWSIVGEYDEYDDLNAGMKYRLLYR